MDERIDVVNTKGMPTGKTCLKSEAHQHGILHGTVHIWLHTKDLQILIQKRSESKEIYPNLWDVSVAGHISSGESPILAALREVKEEIDLSINQEQLKSIPPFEEKHYHANNIVDHEIHHIYLVKLHVDLSKLTPQKEEVEALRLISTKELQNNYTNPDVFVPHTPEYYKHILKYLKENKS